MNNGIDTLLISVDFSRGSGNDANVLIVGRKQPNQTAEIINAFQGEEAEELYRKLTIIKKKED